MICSRAAHQIRCMAHSKSAPVSVMANAGKSGTCGIPMGHSLRLPGRIRANSFGLLHRLAVEAIGGALSLCESVIMNERCSWRQVAQKGGRGLRRVR